MSVVATKPLSTATVTMTPEAGKLGLTRVGPLMNVCGDATRFIKGNPLRFVLYGAYNACGLIGSEHNGIAVLHESWKQVIADNIAREHSGSHGPSLSQVLAFQRMLTADEDEVLDLINSSDRLRMELVQQD